MLRGTVDAQADYVQGADAWTFGGTRVLAHATRYGIHRSGNVVPSPPLRGGEGQGEVGRVAPDRCRTHPISTLRSEILFPTKASAFRICGAPPHPSPLRPSGAERESRVMCESSLRGLRVVVGEDAGDDGGEALRGGDVQE